MKKLVVTAVVALGAFTAIQAQEIKGKVVSNVEIQESTEVVPAATTQANAKLLAKADVVAVPFKKIEVSQLPVAVSKAVAADYKGAAIQEVYVDEDQLFKLVLVTTTKETVANTKIVFATEDGTWVQRPQAIQKQ